MTDSSGAGCSGKVRHPSRKQAQAALRVHRAAAVIGGKKVGPLHVYLCPACSGYHLANGDRLRTRGTRPGSAAPHKFRCTDPYRPSDEQPPD